MSAKHTPGPWFISRPYQTLYIESRIAGGMIQEVAAIGPNANGWSESEANARRIVACVNACESFSTEMLEGAMSAVVQGGFVGLWSNYCDKKSEAEDLRAQRDELLAALLHIEGAAMDVSCERASIRDAARAAIAKATGGKA